MCNLEGVLDVDDLLDVLEIQRFECEVNLSRLLDPMYSRMGYDFEYLGDMEE
mgnify:CR=1 FL=1